MLIIDSHCHLDDYLANNELDQILHNAKEAGVEKLISVGTSAEDWPLYAKLAQEYPNVIYYTVGIHPCYVDTKSIHTIDQLANYFLKETKPVAFGEIGLDYHHLPEDPEEIELVKKIQKEAFIKQLDIARNIDCPIVIHSRKAFDDTVKIIDQSGLDWSRFIFHCFPEAPDCMQILIDKGARASFTGIITYKNAEEVRQSALLQGLDKLIIETDAPYLAPTPKRGKRNEPAYTRYIAEFCADLFQVSLVEFNKIVSKNTQDFFKM